MPKSIIITIVLLLLFSFVLSQPRNLRVSSSPSSKSPHGPICSLCLSTVGVLSQTYKLLPTTLIRNILEVLCIRKTKNKNLCDPVSQELTPIIIQSVWKRFLNPKRVCGELGMCRKFYRKLDLQQEIHRIIDTKPKENKKALPATTNSTFKILQISDIHLDLQYRQGYSNTCDDIICCHLQNGRASNPSQSSGHFGDHKCDPPLLLLDQALSFIRKTLPDLKLILVSGDMSAHNEWTKSIQSNNFITQTVIDRLGGINADIVFALGNNECFPDHQFDSTKEEDLKAGISIAMGKYLTKDERETLGRYGYYARKVPNMNLKVIALNGEVCDNMNFYLIANVTDPSMELEWLEKELSESESKGQAVYIVSHIPPNLLQCSTTWSQIYRALVSRYNNTLVGQFYGHTHNDQFAIYTHSLTKQPVSLLFSAPSFATLLKHQPSFRVYEVDSQTYQVVNYYQYSADLIKANKEKDKDMQWEVTYNFTGEYGLKELSVTEVSRLREKMAVDEELQKKYRSHILGGMPSTYDLRQLFCMTYDSHDSVYKCLNITASSDKMSYLLEKFQGPWMMKVR